MTRTSSPEEPDSEPVQVALVNLASHHMLLPPHSSTGSQLSHAMMIMVHHDAWLHKFLGVHLDVSSCVVVWPSRLVDDVPSESFEGASGIVGLGSQQLEVTLLDLVGPDSPSLDASPLIGVERGPTGVYSADRRMRKTFAGCITESDYVDAGIAIVMRC
eukprot:965977-Rhodomonas_salina.2